MCTDHSTCFLELVEINLLRMNVLPKAVSYILCWVSIFYNAITKMCVAVIIEWRQVPLTRLHVNILYMRVLLN